MLDSEYNLLNKISLLTTGESFSELVRLANVGDSYENENGNIYIYETIEADPSIAIDDENKIKIGTEIKSMEITSMERSLAILVNCLEKFNEMIEETTPPIDELSQEDEEPCLLLSNCSL